MATPEQVREAIERGASQQEVQSLVNELATNPPPSRPVANAILRGFAELGGGGGGDSCGGQNDNCIGQ